MSLVCVIVTSSAAAGVYLERHLANLRLGMLLELFTASGALLGGLVAFLLPERVLAGLFAAPPGLHGVQHASSRPAAPAATDAGDELGTADAALEPDPGAAFGDELAGPGYRPRRLGVGAGGSLGAGIVSALLGVGGGIVKVPLMHLVMGVPLKVATATSNLMIGVTAAASAIVYLLRGGIDPYVAGPTAVGVFVGALVGLADRLADRRPPAAPALRRRPRPDGGPDGRAGTCMSDPVATPRPTPGGRPRRRRGPPRAPPHDRHRLRRRAPRDRQPPARRRRHLAARRGLAAARPARRCRPTSLALEPAGFLWLGLLATIATPHPPGERRRARVRAGGRAPDGRPRGRRPGRHRAGGRRRLAGGLRRGPAAGPPSILEVPARAGRPPGDPCEGADRMLTQKPAAEAAPRPPARPPISPPASASSRAATSRSARRTSAS